jgi:hypothetical protein
VVRGVVCVCMRVCVCVCVKGERGREGQLLVRVCTCVVCLRCGVGGSGGLCLGQKSGCGVFGFAFLFEMA